MFPVSDLIYFCRSNGLTRSHTAPPPPAATRPQTTATNKIEDLKANHARIRQFNSVTPNLQSAAVTKDDSREKALNQAYRSHLCAFLRDKDKFLFESQQVVKVPEKKVIGYHNIL